MSNKFNQSELADKIMSQGIASLVLSAIFGVPGIITSIKTKRKAAEYERRYGNLSGKAKVGSVFATVALPLSIVATVFFVVYFIILFSVAAFV